MAVQTENNDLKFSLSTNRSKFGKQIHILSPVRQSSRIAESKETSLSSMDAQQNSTMAPFDSREHQSCSAQNCIQPKRI